MPVVLTYTTDMHEQTFSHVLVPGELFPLEVDRVEPTVWMISIAHFAVGILLLHHYKRDLAHLSYFESLVSGLSKFER